MKEKKVLKMMLSIFFLILAILSIIVMGIFIYKINNDKLTKTAEQSNSSNSSIETPTTNNSDKNDVIYAVSVRDEVYATIKANKNGKIISKEFEMGAMITDTGTMELPAIGTVALVADSGGEYYGVSIYQLVNGEIKLIGNIDCGADMVKEATYTVETKNEATAIISAKRNNEDIKKEFEMSAVIANTSVIDIFNCGKVVLVAETGGEYYGIQVYRLSQDYTTGKTKEIKKVGSIQYNI